MTPASPVLHLLCGKAASGKSTLAARLADAPGTLLVAQDPWMAALYPGMRTVGDHLRHAPRSRAAMGPHLVAVLRAGLSVTLDRPANTVETRAWTLGIAREARAGHRPTGSTFRTRRASTGWTRATGRGCTPTARPRRSSRKSPRCSSRRPGRRGCGSSNIADAATLDAALGPALRLR